MKKIFGFSFAILTMLFASFQANATHIAGGQLTYAYAGNNGLDYDITYTFYRDCAGNPAPGTVTIVTSSVNAGVSFNTTSAAGVNNGNVVPVCPSATTTCSGGATPGRAELVYTATITLPSKQTDWVFSVSLTDRNNAITTINPTTVAMYVESTLNNTLGAPDYNNAPFFANNPAAFVYANQTFCFNNGTVDVDGDSLAYSLIPPKTSRTTNVSYIFPYTFSQPLTSSPPVTINTATGDVCMFPTALEITVMAILVQEYRYGQLIGSVERDIQVAVISGTDNLPYMDGINSTNTYFDTIAAGCNYTFTTNGFDADASQCVTMSTTAATVPFFNSFTTTGGCPSLTRPTGTFDFSPGGGDVRSQPYYFTVTVRDDFCNIEGQQVRAFGLYVIDFTADFTSSAPACVGQAVNFYSVQPFKSYYTYVWNFGAGSVASYAMVTSANPTGVTYTTPGAKTVQLTIIGPGGCSVTTTNVITINPSPTSSFTSNAPQCIGTGIDFTNTGTTGAGITYSWDFGTGASPANSVSQDPAGVLYASSGSKTVTLTTTNNLGCVTTSTQTIAINETPFAGFTSTAPQCTGLPVDFTNTGTTSGVTWSWNFGSGATPATSTSQNPAGIVYSSSGIKSVSLTTTNTTTGCAVSAVNTINIYLTPTVSFTSNAPQCTTVAINFTNTGSTGGNWSYFWNFGQNANPSTSVAENPTGILYSAGGNKTVTFTISDQNCTQTSTQTILISATPAASFTSTAPKCTGANVDFTNTGTSVGVIWAWNFGSGASPATSTAQNPTGVTYSTAGTKVVSLTTTNLTTSCTSVYTATLNINQTPTSSFVSNAPQCANTGISFTNTGSAGGGWNYFWDFGVGASPPTSIAQNPSSVIYDPAGTKTVTFTVSDANCSATSTQSITVNPSPVASFSSNSPVCTGDSVNFQNMGTSGANYFWTFGSGAAPAASSAQNPVGIIYGTSGIKTITLVTSLGTCTDTSVQSVLINQTPAPSFTHNAPQCEGAAVSFTYTGTNDTNWTFFWDFGMGGSPPISSQQYPGSVIYYGAGTKTVLLTVSNGSCSEVAEETFSISPKPVAGFSSTAPSCTGDSVDFLNTGSTGASYLWSFGTFSAPASSTDESPQNIVYLNGGIKTVSLITTLGSCTDTSAQTINITQTPAPSFTHNAPQCEGVPITFTYTGTNDTNWTFIWDFGYGATPSSSSQQYPPGVRYIGGGSKTILLTVANGLCSEVAEQTFTVNSLPAVNPGNDTTICANTCVTIGGASVSGLTYSWTDPDNTLSQVNIANPVACPEGILTVYHLTVTDAAGCQNRDSVNVAMLLPLKAEAGVDVEICFGDSVQIGTGLIEGQFYSWSPSASLDNATKPNPVAKPDSSTTYMLMVMDDYGCTPVMDEVLVTVHPLPDAKATDIYGSDTSYIMPGSSIGLLATGGVQYTWLPEKGLDFPAVENPVAKPDSTTDYIVTVTDIHGCINTDTVRVDVADSIVVFIPTVFTPDGNGVNDVLYVRGTGKGSFIIRIFDRWGGQIFISDDPLVGWNGNSHNSGEPLPEGAYVYSYEVMDMDGKAVKGSGIINLVR